MACDLYDTNNNVAGATVGAELTTRTVVLEIKYFCTKNVVIHTENCKLNLPLDCSTTQMEKNIRRMCGIDESSRRRGFADFTLEVFYIDFNEHDPSDQTGKSKNTYKSHGRFSAGRNGRNVKWQGLIAINSLLEGFITV